jgi:hypothetical protein
MDDNMPNFITNYDDLVTLSNKNKQNNNSNINLDSDYNSDNLEQSFIGKMFTNLEKKIKKDVEENISIKYKKNDAIGVGELSLFERKKSIIKNIIQLKKNNEWDEYYKIYAKKIDINTSLKFRIKTIFNVNSDFVVIWKFTFSIFVITIVYLYFLKYMLIGLPKEKKDIKPNVIVIYRLINLMFLFEFIFSIFIMISNGGSLLSYIKIPLKGYNVIPFELCQENFFYILPKFIRLDIIEKLFKNLEIYTNRLINTNIQNYYIKIFLNYMNHMLKYLFNFGLYAHFMACIFCKLSDNHNNDYIYSLYYTIETFTTVGFGSLTPENKYLIFIVIINLFFGVNFFSVITSNIQYLYAKIYGFNKDIVFSKQFESLIFKLEKSTGKVFPEGIKKQINSNNLFRRGLSFKDIKDKYSDIFSLIRYDVRNDIRINLFNFLHKEYSIFFKNCDKEFIYQIYENLKPKVFSKGKILIDYGEKVDKMYFLLNGDIFAYNKNDEVIFCLNESSIFGEYEFITGLISDIKYQVHPNKPAYGFILRRKDWEEICKIDIITNNEFLNKSIIRKKKHLKWINQSNFKFEKIDFTKIRCDLNAQDKIDILAKNITDLEFQIEDMNKYLKNKKKVSFDLS